MVLLRGCRLWEGQTRAFCRSRFAPLLPRRVRPARARWPGPGRGLAPLRRSLLDCSSREQREGIQRNFSFLSFEEENRQPDYLRKGEGVVDQLPVDSTIAHYVGVLESGAGPGDPRRPGRRPGVCPTE